MSLTWKIKVLYYIPPPQLTIISTLVKIICFSYILCVVLPSLLPLVTTSDPCLRHGALYAVAELTHALSEHAQSINQTLVEFLGQDIITELINIAPRVSYICIGRNKSQDYCICVCVRAVFVADISRSVQGSCWGDYETHRWSNGRLPVDFSSLSHSLTQLQP